MIAGIYTAHFDAECVVCPIAHFCSVVQDKDVSKMETIHESEEVSTNDIDGWFEVGPKNRTSTVRTVSHCIEHIDGRTV